MKPAKSTVALVDTQRLARQAAVQGRWQEVQRACEQGLAVAPQDAELHFLHGVSCLELRRWAAAIYSLNVAVQLDSQSAEYQTQLARALSAVNRLPEAAAAAQRALQLKPARTLSLDTMGVVLSRANQHDLAVEAFRLAVTREPHNAGFQFNLAASLKFTGDFSASETAYEACIAADPHYWKAHSALSQLRRQTPQQNHLQRLQRLIPAAEGDIDGTLHLRHALAKELEDLGDYPGALKQLWMGKAPKRAQLGYSIAHDQALFEALTQAFTAPLAPLAGCATPEPIFVMGMPRSGTTLVDRILSSHAQVISAGELQNFGLELKRGAGTRGPRLLDAETIAAGMACSRAELGERYLQSTRPATGHSAHFVDKMPLNFLYAGFIAQALPNAKMICLRRNAMDTCLSNFRQLFALNYSYYNYAYDLLDTGRYYLLFDRLMTHWRELFPGRILQLHYEDLVRDQETETRRLLEFCALPWNADCLAFERNTAPVSTASAVQVRSALYSGAVGRWKRYGDAVGELQALLQGAGIELDAGDAPSG